MPQQTLDTMRNQAETLGHALSARLSHAEPDMVSVAYIAGQLQRLAKKIAEKEQSLEIDAGLSDECRRNRKEFGIK